MTVEGSKKGKTDESIQEKIDSIKSKTKEKKTQNTKWILRQQLFQCKHR